MLCTFPETVRLMPEVKPILDELLNSGTLEHDEDYYRVDVKIHMLMPEQYPCIPNWHRDFVPRDETLNKSLEGLSDDKMYMWISSAPLTEYLDEEHKKYFKESQKWSSFTQHDLHRGTKCEEHIWRCFIRVIPKHFIHSTTINVGELRRHTQVYLDSKKFTW